MSITKRLRVLWAGLRQSWVEEECVSCKREYWSQASVNRPGENMCPECETRTFARWLKTNEQFYDKEIA